ncbi:hypothetical protein [uncultured Bacteroides sp.]|uniref:hypothetical protein n=1 Tax=uncultured Bacteroides sp. TaxID=162156 RepID=UPI002AA6E754|nr:hypothetical protein [uncultured Bacteroides sp.]
MKARFFVFFFFLSLVSQLNLNASCVPNEVLNRKQVRIKLSADKIVTRAPTLTATGYVEDGCLFLFFNQSFNGASVCITDMGTGVVVYDDANFTGDSLVASPVDENSSGFNISIVSGDVTITGEINFE